MIWELQLCRFFSPQELQLSMSKFSWFESFRLSKAGNWITLAWDAIERQHICQGSKKRRTWLMVTIMLYALWPLEWCAIYLRQKKFRYTSTQIFPQANYIQPILGHSVKYVKRFLKPGIVRIFALVHWVCTPLSCQSKNAIIQIFWLNRSIAAVFWEFLK